VWGVLGRSTAGSSAPPRRGAGAPCRRANHVVVVRAQRDPRAGRNATARWPPAALCAASWTSPGPACRGPGLTRAACRGPGLTTDTQGLWSLGGCARGPVSLGGAFPTRSATAQWGLDRVPYRSANPLQWRVTDCLQVWKSGRVSHEQHDFLQQRSAEQLIVVHLCKKKTEDRCFSFMESTVTVRGSCAKNFQRDPPFFSAHDKPLLFLTCRKPAGKMLQVAACRCWCASVAPPNLVRNFQGRGTTDKIRKLA